MRHMLGAFEVYHRNFKKGPFGGRLRAFLIFFMGGRRGFLSAPAVL
jgi:hypothetical protein